MLLLVTENEEDTFWLLKVLTENILPNYYAPDIPGLLTDVKVLEELIRYTQSFLIFLTFWLCILPIQ